MRLYIGSLHFNITEEMLKGIFEPFGKIQQLQLIMDTETGRSKGYGFVTVSTNECCAGWQNVGGLRFTVPPSARFCLG